MTSHNRSTRRFHNADCAVSPGHRRQQGSTLIEQIMVLAIVVLLAGMATPPLRKMLTRSQVQAAQADFIAGLQHARGTAITSGRQTLFCPTLDGTRCSNTNRWETGWLLAHDSNLDNQPDNGPLYTAPGYAGKVMIQSSVGRRFVRFHADGSASGSNLTLLFCSPNSIDNVLSVVISNVGRVRGAPATAAQAATCAQMR
jgi:type IV fimbrial biogenesis protein FimT